MGGSRPAGEGPAGQQAVLQGSPGFIAFGSGESGRLIYASERPVAAFHVAFSAPSREAVDRFHAAALEAGGRDNGAPGLRPEYHEGYYGAAIYIDGPHHDYPERQNRDAAKTEAMEDLGYMVIRFGHQDDWNEMINQYPYIFGSEV